MLCLGRKKDQVLWIGDARVQVLEIREGSVRLGITAPQEVAVVRQEVLDRPRSRTRAGNQAAQGMKVVTRRRTSEASAGAVPAPDPAQGGTA